MPNPQYQDALTPNEEFLVMLVFQGLMPEKMAQLTGRNVCTIRKDISNAYSKLGVSGAMELVQKAKDEGGLLLWIDNHGVLLWLMRQASVSDEVKAVIRRKFEEVRAREIGGSDERNV
jgi:DNA-binding CsgD family transcriptional regulator